MTTSRAYKQAVKAHNAALAEFRRAQEQYRAQRIGDAAFLAARAKKIEADSAFDRAFEREQVRGEA